jgi:hypothetical protein
VRALALSGPGGLDRRAGRATGPRIGEAAGPFTRREDPVPRPEPAGARSARSATRLALAIGLGTLLLLAAAAPSSAQAVFYLYRHNGERSLLQVAPTDAEATFSISQSLSLLSGNQWRNAGTWSGRLQIASPVFITRAGELHVWLGLRSSADTAAAFDVRAEVWVGSADGQSAQIAHGVAHCVRGLDRDPSRALEVVVPLSSAPVSFDTGTETVGLKLSARIGTTPQGRRCTGPGYGQASSLGLRIYHGGVHQPSGFDLSLIIP